MGLHPRARIKKKLLWLERKRREKGRNPNPNQNPVKGARRKICQKLNASIVMNFATMPPSVHIRRQARRP